LNLNQKDVSVVQSFLQKAEILLKNNKITAPSDSEILTSIENALSALSSLNQMDFENQKFLNVEIAPTSVNMEEI